MSAVNVRAGESPYQQRAIEAGLTEVMIRDVVDVFYGKVRRDPALAPVFNGVIGEHWDEHLEKITSFWLFVTRLKEGYRSRDFMPAHLKHAAIRADLLPQWLHLFRQTVNAICPPDAAAVLVEIAEGMADSIRISLARRDASTAG